MGFEMLRKLAIANLALLAILLASAIVNAWTHGTVAQSILSSLQVSGSDPVLGGDATNRRMVIINDTMNGVNIQSGFGNSVGMDLTIRANGDPGGTNTNGGVNSSKTTFAPLFLTSVYQSWGQKFGLGNNITCFGMGDCGPIANTLTYAGGPVNGDEGSASVFQTAQELQALTLATQVGASVQSTCNTTLTQVVNATYPVVGGSATSLPTQAVTVASTTGCNVGDWLVIGSSLPTSSPDNEAVQITAVGGGTITAAFRLHHLNGAPVTGALVLNVNDASQFGLGRVLVNLSGTSYSTGTVSSIVGGGFTGSGTTWTNGMVGGSAANIGCIALAADTFNGAPWFSGSGTSGPLKSWYQITTVVSNTSIGIYSNSVPGDASYHGLGPGSGSYQILPCVAVLQIIGNQVIAETTSTTWSNGNNLELVHTPYPDVTQQQFSISKFGAGGIFRGWTEVTNRGARKGNHGLFFDGSVMVDPGVITAPGTGYTAGTYNNVPVTGGLGTGMTANVTVAGGAVTGFTRVLPGSGYAAGDVLSVAAANIGGTGSGFQFTFNGSDKPIAWEAGIQMSGVNTGLYIVDAAQQAIVLGNTPSSSKIQWNNAGVSMSYNPAVTGLTWTTIGSGQGGVLSASNATSNTWAWLNYNGFIGTTPNTVSTLPTCDGTHAGMGRWVTDSTGTTFGSTVTPGGGSGKGQAMCDGTNWVFH